jgi:hypothetical protein
LHWGADRSSLELAALALRVGDALSLLVLRKWSTMALITVGVSGTHGHVLPCYLLSLVLCCLASHGLILTLLRFKLLFESILQIISRFVFLELELVSNVNCIARGLVLYESLVFLLESIFVVFVN